jgi:hypothetical protein
VAREIYIYTASPFCVFTHFSLVNIIAILTDVHKILHGEKGMLSVALEKALSEGDMTIGVCVCVCMCVVREILEIHFLEK